MGWFLDSVLCDCYTYLSSHDYRNVLITVVLFFKKLCHLAVHIIQFCTYFPWVSSLLLARRNPTWVLELVSFQNKTRWDFYLWLHWIYSSIQREMLSLQYWVFQFMNMVYLFLRRGILNFFQWCVIFYAKILHSFHSIYS